MDMTIEFISICEKKPPYGAPVLLKISGVVQHIVYMLDGFDDTPDWFEPYFFEHDDELKIKWDSVEEWALLPDWSA